MNLTPSQYAKKYQELDVYIYTDEQAQASVGGSLPPGGEWVTVSVTSYRLGLRQAYGQKRDSIDVFKEKVRPHIDEKGESITVWVKTVNGDVVSKTYTSRLQLAENVNDPFYGKGSPEEVQVVLQLAVRYGVFPKEKLQTYCDNGNIGLDCNGFVGNYLRHIKQEKSWDTDARTKAEIKTEFDANTAIASIMSFNGFTMPVKTVEEIDAQPLSIYLFALCDDRGRILDHVKNPDGTTAYGHITITEPASYMRFPFMYNDGKQYTDVPLFTVFESTGGVGLLGSAYYILDVNRYGAFTVYRGSKDQTMKVKITRLL